jgi:hypothetical protein
MALARFALVAQLPSRSRSAGWLQTKCDSPQTKYVVYRPDVTSSGSFEGFARTARATLRSSHPRSPHSETPS